MSNLAEEKKYTYKDYITWNDKIRYELIDGAAYAMASPSRLHQKISGELHGRLWQFLRGRTCEVYSAPFDVRLNFAGLDDIVVQPDILVVCDESKHDGKSVKGAPDLIIEILSPYNTRHDTVTKTRLYRRAGVREYWIVDPNEKTVQVCILENGRYIVSDYNENDVVSVHILEGCQINLADIFYNTVESAESEYDSEFITMQKIIEVLKKNGINDNKIEQIINSINNIK
ncbi:MAG: Uma2 family endonuclease [Oscillospiraceae bacterium]|nr:Uma2 family endonuclease [Oscillospiraceae bacterium]